MNFSTLFSKTERPYHGPELRPHFLLTELGLKGSALGAFIGPCSVKTDHLVDWEDRLANDFIQAKWMVHFIGEFFGASLREGVLYQRLLISIMAELINERLYRRPVPLALGEVSMVRREGDDLFVGSAAAAGARKLSVSIVTSSPVSQLLHAGINIDPAGAPVPAIGLKELDIIPEEWVPAVLERFSAERESIEWACAKVRPVV